MKSYQQIRCQRCRAVNPLGEELCAQCGTRLMLVVEPFALRFEEEALAAEQAEGQVAERLSLMENHLSRFIGHLERSTDLLTQQAQIVTREHLLLETLIEMLGARGVIEVAELERLWTASCARSAESARQKQLRDEVRAEIVQAYKGRAAREFAQLVNEGFDAFDRADVDGGWRVLERAAALAPANALLNALLGRQFFGTGKRQLARSYLERAHKAAPADAVSCLLLAIMRGDDGDSAGAAELLDEAERRGGAARFAVHYARGRLLAHAGRWRDALAAFKRALAAHDAAETHYVVALAAYQLDYDRLAARHIDRALALDPKYAHAHALQGLLFGRAGDLARMRAAFAQVRALRASQTDGQRGWRRSPGFIEKSLLSDFFGVGAQRTQLLTGGDARLANLLREQAQGI